MGLFSFCYSDSGFNITLWDGARYKSPRGEKYDVVGSYNGYGEIDGVDVYYLLAIDNRKHILSTQTLKENANEYEQKFFDKSISDDYFYENARNFEFTDVIRNYGIEAYFSCGSGEGVNYKTTLPYPLKIVTIDCKDDYYSLSPSCDDPAQGCGRYHIEKGEFYGCCMYCGCELWTSNDILENDNGIFCSEDCKENFMELYENEEE